MDLREIVSLLGRRWLPIVLLTVLGGVAAFGFTQNQPKIYTAQATVLVQPGSGRTTSDLNDGAVFVQRVVQTYAGLTRTPVVLDPVAEKLGLPAGSLTPHVTAAITSGTTFLTVRSSWTDPQKAADIANGVADQLRVAITQVSPESDGQPSVVVSTITPATAPSTPSSPSMVTNLAVGLLVGLLVGVGYVVLVTALDTRVRTSTDVRKVTSTPVLGVVSRPRRPSASTIPETNPWSEDYRRVRTNLRLLDMDQRPGSIVVTSCTGDEGMVNVAFNVARTAVEGGLAVVLVESNLRRPALATALELGEGPGVGEIVTGAATVEQALHTVDGVDIVHAGGAVRSPGDVVTSAAMSTLLDSLAERYELVVVDAPPLLEVADGAALGAGAHGVVLVVGRPRVTRDQVAEAVESLRMAGATLLGVILNDAPDVLPSALPARGSGARRRGSRGGALTDDTARDTDVPSPKRHDEAGTAHQAAPAADDDRPAEGDAPEARLAPAVLGGPTDGDDRI